MKIADMRCFVKWIFILMLVTSAHANSDRTSFDFNRVNLADAIRVIAKILHRDVMVSPLVRGTVTLHVKNTNATEAFSLLLTMYALESWRTGHIWYVAPREELIKNKQEESKWQEVSDESVPLVTEIWQMHYAKAEEIAHMLQDDHASMISKRGRIRLDTRTNIICVQDLPSKIALIRTLIRRIDVPVRQIVIEARLASVDNDFERDLGIKFNVLPPKDQQQDAGKLGRELSNYSISVAKLADGSLLDVKLAALENAGHAELISNPSLFTANQQPASIEAGEEVPYQQVSESGGTAVVFKKAVLGLRVTPQILPGKKVLMQLQVNQDRPGNRMVLGVPVISTRQITTSVLAADGQTVVLGGIYESNSENVEQGMPFLSQIPLLGMLFKEKNTRTSKRELLIFVTPRIISQDT